MANHKQLEDISSVPSIEDDSNWFTFVFMTYLDTLFAKGFKKTLELSDLGGISKQDRSDVLHEKFSREYEQECHKPLEKRSLWGVLWRTVGYFKLFMGVALFGVSAALQFGPVLILTRLVRYFQGIQYYSQSSLWGLVVLLFIFPVVASIALAHSNAIMAHLGAQIRNTLIGVIYRKSLLISPYYRQSVSTGRIVTMFSDDTNQIRNFLYFLNNFVIAPLQIAVCLYLIYEQVGAATFVGLGYALLTMPLSGFVFGLVFAIRKLKMKYTDSRVKLMNEILNGIRIIKYYAWESAFIGKVGEIRNGEVKLLAKTGYIFNSVFGLFLLGAPQIQTVLIFLTFIGTNHQLDAATAFTTLTLFGLMTSPFIFLPFGLQQYNMSLISMKRIMEFLDANNLESYITYADLSGDEKSQDVVVEFTDASFSWIPKDQEGKENTLALANKGPQIAKKDDNGQNSSNSNDGKKYEAVAAVADEESNTDQLTNKAIHTLRNVTMSVKKGELVAVVGTVGSGKSSLLSAILGEMHLRGGSLTIAMNNSALPTVAYCDQRPWIVNATVKDNVLFGLPFDEAKFNAALTAACMEDDLKILTAGIFTEIGERGINLSGGQKARVCLARAIYADADIYLLDDPLSAVDAHVGEHLFSKAIKESLSGKTRFLVTHHLHVLPNVDKILILNSDGTVRAFGSHEELTRSGIDLEQLLVQAIEAETEQEEVENSATDAVKARSRTASHLDATSERLDHDEVIVEAVEEASHVSKVVDVHEVEHVRKNSVDKERRASDAKEKGEKEQVEKDKGALITAEEKREGDVQ